MDDLVFPFVFLLTTFFFSAPFLSEMVYDFDGHIVILDLALFHF